MTLFANRTDLPVLEGPRIDLRWITHDDASALFEIFGDREVMRYWSSPPLENPASAHALVDQIHEYFRTRGLFQWGIRLRASDELVGTVTLYDVSREHRRGALGFALRRTAWGQGYASEAVATLLKFAFETAGLERLEADVDPDNARSLSLLERQGFRREGYLRERWRHLGEVRDTVFLGLLRRQWTGRAQ